LWLTYGVNWWPTLVSSTRMETSSGTVSGEGNSRSWTRPSTSCQRVQGRRQAQGDAAAVQAGAGERSQSALLPRQGAADAASKRLFIADSTNHRIVITSLDGKKIAIAGQAPKASRTASSPRRASATRKA